MSDLKLQEGIYITILHYEIGPERSAFSLNIAVFICRSFT